MPTEPSESNFNPWVSTRSLDYLTTALNAHIPIERSVPEEDQKRLAQTYFRTVQERKPLLWDAIRVLWLSNGCHINGQNEGFIRGLEQLGAVHFVQWAEEAMVATGLISGSLRLDVTTDVVFRPKGESDDSAKR